MAVYQWKRYSVSVGESNYSYADKVYIPSSSGYLYWSPSKPSLTSNGYNLPYAQYIEKNKYPYTNDGYISVDGTNPSTTIATNSSSQTATWNGSEIIVGSMYRTYYEARKSVGSFIDYVYSSSSSAYPNGGYSGGYYYDSMTEIKSASYIGINSVARQVKTGYIGIDNVARKVKIGYIGVNGVARKSFVSLN